MSRTIDLQPVYGVHFSEPQGAPPSATLRFLDTGGYIHFDVRGLPQRTGQLPSAGNANPPVYVLCVSYQDTSVIPVQNYLHYFNVSSVGGAFNDWILGGWDGLFPTIMTEPVVMATVRSKLDDGAFLEPGDEEVFFQGVSIL